MKEDDLKEKIIETKKKINLKKDSVVRVIAYVDQKRSWTQKYDCEIVVKTYRAFENKSTIALYLSNWERININSMPPKIKAGANYINSECLIDAIKGFDTALFK